MSFTPGFDRLAKVWCRKCGQGDTITGHRDIRRHEIFDVEDIENPDGWAEEVREDIEGNVLYICSHCGNEGTDIEEVATSNQNEANNSFKSYNPTNKVEIEQDYYEEESE